MAGRIRARSGRCGSEWDCASGSVCRREERHSMIHGLREGQAPVESPSTAFAERLTDHEHPWHLDHQLARFWSRRRAASLSDSTTSCESPTDPSERLARYTSVGINARPRVSALAGLVRRSSPTRKQNRATSPRQHDPPRDHDSAERHADHRRPHPRAHRGNREAHDGDAAARRARMR